MKLKVRDLKIESEFPSNFENGELRLHRYLLEEIIKENEDGTVLARVIGYSSNREGFDDLINALNIKYSGKHTQEIPNKPRLAQMDDYGNIIGCVEFNGNI